MSNSGEFPGGQSFDALVAAERAKHERQVWTIHGTLGPDGLEERVAASMDDYDRAILRLDETRDYPRTNNHSGRHSSSTQTERPSSERPSWHFDLDERSRPRPSSIARTPRTDRPSRPTPTGRPSRGFGQEDYRRAAAAATTVSAPASKRTAKPNRFSWEKVTAAITAVAAVGSTVLWFTSGSGDEKASAAAGPKPNGVTTVQLADRSLSMYETTTTLLTGDKEEITQAEKSIPRISAGDPQMKGSLNQAFDYAKANNVLEYPSADPETIFAPSSITSEAIRQRVEVASYTFKADTALKSMDGYSGKTPEEAEHAMGEAPKGAETVEAHAKEAIQVNEIDAALTTYRTSTKDDEARAAVQEVVDTVTNPDLKQRMQNIIQGLDTAEILQDLYLKDATSADVLAFAQSVTDPQLKADVVWLAGEVDSSGYYNEAYSYSMQLKNDLYDVQAQQFGDDSTNFAADLSLAKDEQSAIGVEATEAVLDAEATYTETLAEEADLEPGASGPALIQEANPHEVIDLTNLDATEEVPNVLARLAEEGGEDHPEHFDQFGEVYVEDGQMEVAYQEGVSPTIQEQFDQVIESNDPLLKAAFASGNLVSVRFVRADKFNPYYNGATREAIIQVADDDQLTVDQLSSTITHEIGGHANLRDFFQGVEVTDGEHQALAETCFTLQTLTYKDLEGQLSIRPDLLSNLRAAAKPEHQAAIDTLARAVENNNLTSLLTDYTNFESTLSNQCDYTGDPSIMIQNAVFATPDFDMSTYESSDLSYLFESSAYQDFAYAVGLHLEYGSIFSQAINESGYTMTESADKQYLGHSRDNANELFASLMDAALNYSDELQANLAKLDPEEAQAVLRTLGLACNVLEARAPSLKPLLDGTRQKFGIVS